MDGRFLSLLHGGCFAADDSSAAARANASKKKRIEVISLAKDMDLQQVWRFCEGKTEEERPRHRRETLQLISQVGKIAASELYEYFPGARSALVQLKKRGMFVLSMWRCAAHLIEDWESPKKKHVLTPIKACRGGDRILCFLRMRGRYHSLAWDYWKR